MFGSKPDAKTKSLIAIVSSHQARDEVQLITAKLKDVQSSLKFTDDTLRDAGNLVNGSADIVIIEADLAHPDSESVLRKLCDYVSLNGSLIVLGDNVTPGNTRNLFKMGVNDVIAMPLSRDDLLNSLKSAFGKQTENRQTFEKTGHVLTLMKCGGDAGATTLATNIGNALMTGNKAKKSKFGKKQNPVDVPRVAILDFDIQFGNVAVSLNVKPRSNILDVRKAEDRLDAALLSAATGSHDSGLKILSSPEDIVPLEAFSSDFFVQLIQISRAMFDYVIIDMPQAWTSWTQTILDQSDIILPVLTPSVEHVHNCQKILQGLDHLKINRKKTLVIVNQITKGVVAKDRISQISKVIERDIALIREDVKAHNEARDRGVLLQDVSGSSGTLKNLSQCREKILSMIQDTRSELGATSVGRRASDHTSTLGA